MTFHRRILSLILVSIGLLLIFFVSLPVIVSQIHFFLNPPIIDPTSVSSTRPNLVINFFGLNSLDYTQAENWFSPRPSAPSVQSQVKYFTFSIPRLKLSDVSVEVNGTDLSRNAIHFPGTALPGQFGNPVIFGHSALPYFYKPGRPQTIFNPLPKTKIGDEIIVNYDGITYRYVVTKTQEIKPTEIEVLAQRYDKKQITLITCVPLGTYWRRFVATAELVN